MSNNNTAGVYQDNQITAGGRRNHKNTGSIADILHNSINDRNIRDDSNSRAQTASAIFAATRCKKSID